jgi:hypothetical protein
MPLSTSLVQRQRHHHAPKPKTPRQWYFMMGSRYPQRLPRLSPMRRDRGGRDEVDAFIDRYAGLDVYFDDLAIDSWVRRMIDGRLPDRSRFDRRSSDRGRDSEGRRILDEVQYSPRPDIIHDDRGLAMARPVGPPMPFGIAMRDLHRQLGRAEELYTRFQTDYDDDIATVRKYAPARTLREMWYQKVKGARDPQTFAEGEVRTAEGEPERFEEQFTEMETRVFAALQAAASSTLSGGRRSENRQARVDASERLKRRAHLALEQFIDAMERAKRRREDCRYLVNELQQWQTLLNPEIEMNRELYRLSEEEEQELADDAHPEGARLSEV